MRESTGVMVTASGTAVAASAERRGRNLRAVVADLAARKLWVMPFDSTPR